MLLFPLIWLNLKRLMRGWRWRAFLLISAAGAYWFARFKGFGEGASVWFPGGIHGIEGFSVFFAVAAVILGGDCIGQWDRHRARQGFETRLASPFRFALASVLSVTLASLIPSLIACYWAIVGAWRADFYVLWLPNLLYMMTTALPILFCGAAAGLLGRTIFKADLAATAVGILLTVPALVFRLISAPAHEPFQLASASFGVLIPAATLIREALVTGLQGCLWIALTLLLLPSPRKETGGRQRGFLRMELPVVRSLASRFRVQLRQWSRSVLLAAMVLAAIGGVAAVQLVRQFPRIAVAIDWGRFPSVEGVSRTGILRELAIVRRKIALPENAASPMMITMDFAAPGGEAATGLVSFGNTLSLESIESEGAIRVSEIGPPLGNGSPLHLLKFDPPLKGHAAARATFKLTPSTRGRRLWEQAYDTRFHRFSGLGEWFGVSARADFNNATLSTITNESPFEIIAPGAGELQWRAGAAEVSNLGDGRVRIYQPLADNPSRLIAANMMEIPSADSDSLPVTFVLQPQRARLGAQLHRIYSTPFKRLHRLFGDPPEKLFLYEVPENDPADPMAIPSSKLELLEALLPAFDDEFRPTRDHFYFSFTPNHLGLVSEIFVKSFSRIDDADLMASALILYLNDSGLEGGAAQYHRALLEQSDAVLIPWSMARQGRTPFDVARASAADWTGAVIGTDALQRRRPVPKKRLIAFHHLLRGQLGDDAYVRAIRNLTQKHRGEVLTVDLYRRVLEEEYGDSLKWLFDEWLIEGVLPRYEISDAQALLIENRDTRALEYTTQLTIHNRGTGRLEVPWILMTEEEPVRGKAWLGAGESRELLIKSLDRPIAFEIDSNGTIPQITPTGSGDGTDHARVFFKTVREL
ncbi:hypothetical protein IT571_09485 [Candidatus Sumerlaeota bacterium]|nr:hypothetical protein [Candidatus Sumerlaeota bacterium]